MNVHHPAIFSWPTPPPTALPAPEAAAALYSVVLQLAAGFAHEVDLRRALETRIAGVETVLELLNAQVDGMAKMDPPSQAPSAGVGASVGTRRGAQEHSAVGRGSKAVSQEPTKMPMGLQGVDAVARMCRRRVIATTDYVPISPVSLVPPRESGSPWADVATEAATAAQFWIDRDGDVDARNALAGAPARGRPRRPHGRQYHDDNRGMGPYFRRHAPVDNAGQELDDGGAELMNGLKAMGRMVRGEAGELKDGEIMEEEAARP
ncbi:hypothetical protein HK101_007040 [Irineochytrium annulatum]|nr:hypothetical protein HK101_007040 [Irineochytrium annulatum]